MFKKTLWIIAFTLSFVLSQSALADDVNCGDGLQKMLSSVKIDDAQKAKIKPVLDQLKSSMQSIEGQMKNLDTQLKQQMMSATIDQSTVDGLVDKKTKLIGDAMKAKITAKNKILNILTPDQKTAMQNMMQKVEEKMAAKYKNCHDQDN